MTTITRAMTAAEVQYRPSRIRTITRAILHGAWLLIDPIGYLSATTTKAERKEMGVILPEDER